MNSCENIVGTVQPTLKIIGEVETPLGGGGGGGKDGISPTVEMIDIDGGTRIIITDVNGPKSTDIMDGKDGKDGVDGATPIKGTDYFTEADKAEIAQQAAGMVDVSGFVSKVYLVGVFEELKVAIAESNIDAAVAILDEAILDLSALS